MIGKQEDNTKKIIQNGLFEEIEDALMNLNGWGSVEIIVQNNQVTQISGRRIKKINHSL